MLCSGLSVLSFSPHSPWPIPATHSNINLDNLRNSVANNNLVIGSSSRITSVLCQLSAISLHFQLGKFSAVACTLARPIFETDHRQ